MLYDQTQLFSAFDVGCRGVCSTFDNIKADIYVLEDQKSSFSGSKLTVTLTKLFS